MEGGGRERRGRGRLNYVDFTLIRLADPALRNSLFDADALEQIAFAAYGPEAAELGPPYSAAFTEVQIGVSIPQRAIADESGARPEPRGSRDASFCRAWAAKFPL